MILFIWLSIHKPHVDKEIIVNKSLILKGRLHVLKLFNEVVISNKLKMKDFI